MLASPTLAYVKLAIEYILFKSSLLCSDTKGTKISSIDKVEERFRLDVLIVIKRAHIVIYLELCNTQVFNIYL